MKISYVDFEWRGKIVRIDELTSCNWGKMYFVRDNKKTALIPEHIQSIIEKELDLNNRLIEIIEQKTDSEYELYIEGEMQKSNEER